MKIIVDIYHPARVHFYKNFIKIMENKGHEVLVTASEKDVSTYLLKYYGINHIVLGSYGSTWFKKIINLISFDIKMYFIVKKYKPDLLIGSFRAAHVSKLFKIPLVDFLDDEYGYIFNKYFYDEVIVFSGFKKKDKKIKKINGYKELAYLNDKYFQPNKDIFKSLGINKNDKYVLLRFVAWNAYHDLGKSKFDLDLLYKYVHILEKYAKVYISSEDKLPKDLEKYYIPVNPDQIHDLLFFAHLFFSDSQTMTTEAAILGTPAIRTNEFVGDKDMGNFIELEKTYGLIFNFKDSEKAIKKAIELLKKDDIKKEWKNKRDFMLKDKIDVTDFMINYIENKFDIENIT